VHGRRRDSDSGSCDDSDASDLLELFEVLRSWGSSDSAYPAVLLFVANDAGGLRVIDVTGLHNPHEIAKHINARVGSKPQAYNNVVVANGTAYVALVDAVSRSWICARPRRSDNSAGGTDSGPHPYRGTWSGSRAVSLR
jgi:hypothetical protein